MNLLKFGYDLGANSVGWAVVKYYDEGVDILGMGSRIVPSDPDFHGKFYSGNTASKNAERTLKRGIRRNNQRWKQRRDALKALLIDYGWYDENLINLGSLQLYGLRDRAIKQKLTLQELGRIFIHLNQRRGFKSNRIGSSEEENETDYKERIKQLTASLGEKTIGQKIYEELLEDPKKLIRNRVYFRSDYRREFDKIWSTQQKFHPELTGSPHTKDKSTLYGRIADQIIFYQRPLKSAKHLVSQCRYEPSLKVAPVTSPYYQLFVIYQQVNNVELTHLDTGSAVRLNMKQRSLIFDALHDPALVNKAGKLSLTKLYRILQIKKDEVAINYAELNGNKTYLTLLRAIKELKINKDILSFDWRQSDDQLMRGGGLYRLWHTLYSIPEEVHVVKSLIKNFQLSEAEAKSLSHKIKFSTDHGRVSTKAIRKLLPHLREGLMYSAACNAVDYDHSGYKTEVALLDSLPLLSKHELRNPVVEQVINQMVNITNALIDKYGKPDEICVELSRDIRNNAKRRKEMTARNKSNKKRNDQIRKTLSEELGYKIVNGRDVQRYKLWEETDKLCLYCGQNISQQELISGLANIEHVLPRSRSFNDSLSNKIISHQTCNSDKNQMTARDYMTTKGQHEVDRYLNICSSLYNDRKISKVKYDNLMRSGKEIPNDFINRQAQDTSYISTAAVTHLKKICAKISVSSGYVTDYLRSEWKLKHLLRELNQPKYEAAGLTSKKTIKTGKDQTKEITLLEGWTKRDDQRHHAIDALLTALTTPRIIFALNNRNKLYQYQNEQFSDEQFDELKNQWMETTGEEWIGSIFDMARIQEHFISPPIPDLRRVVGHHLNSMLISFKKSDSKALSVSYNRVKNSQKPAIKTLVPRGALHEDTVRGKTKRYKKVSIDRKLKNHNLIVDTDIREYLVTRLMKYDNSPTKAYTPKALKKDPIILKNKILIHITIWEDVYTKRVDIKQLSSAQLKKIMDKRISSVVNEYVLSHNGDLKKAWNGLNSKPIKINGNILKKVTVEDNGTYESLRIKSRVDQTPIDYVKLGNNHHALIYKNDEGVYSSRLISLYEAVVIGIQNYDEQGILTSVIDLSPHPDTGAPCVMSLQKNDLVIIDCNKDSIKHRDLPEISKHLYRVQKISTTGKSLDIMFRHHLETSVDKSKTTASVRGITWEQFQADKHFARLRKVKVNNLGDILSVEG